MTKHAAHPHEKPHHPHWPLAGLLFAFVALLGVFSVHDASTWVHVKTGARILASHAIPRVDPYSYSMAGRPWTTGSWLSDVIFFVLHRAFGPQGVVLLKSLAAAAAFALLLPINPASPLTAATTLGLGAAACWPWFTEKPAIFDLLMISVLIRILRPRKAFRWTVVAQVAAVELLWANLHGARAVLGVWMALLKIFKTSMRTTQRERLKYGAVLAAAVLGLAFNPHGLGIAARAAQGLGADGSSWRPFSEWLNLYVLFAAAGLASSFIVLQQEFFLTINAVTLLIFSLLVPSMRAAFILSACPVVALAIGHYLPPKPMTALRFTRWAALMAALFALHWAAIYLPLGRWRGYGVTSLEGALHYLQDNGVRGRMFNEAETGDYLIGRSERPVFIDGRASLYDASFAKDAARWPVSFRALAGIYRFDYAVLLNRRASYPARVLDEDPGWRLVYADDDALVYVRRNGADGWLAQNLGATALAPNRLWPDGLDEPLKRLPQASKVLSELDRWILESPDAAQPLLWKAYALDRLKLSEKADRWLALARARPAAREPELASALAFVEAGRGDGAEAERLLLDAERVAHRRDDEALSSKIESQLAALARGRGEEDRAREYEERARRFSASAPADE